jgi:hypothetical protein
MPGLALITMTCLLLLSAGCALVAWRQASACSRIRKRVHDLELSTADLNASLENLLDSHKRLRSREGMRELRSRRAGKTADRPESKGELLARLGLAGKAGPDFARAQLNLNADDSD